MRGGEVLDGQTVVRGSRLLDLRLGTWLRVLPQKEQRISPPNEPVSLLGMGYSWLCSTREVMTLSTRPYSQASVARM